MLSWIWAAPAFPSKLHIKTIPSRLLACSHRKRAGPARNFSYKIIASTPYPTSATSPIAVLPLAVVQRIASGETIHSTACVVRELVENALDANATRITIELHTATCTVIVRDNGAGITVTDLPLAASCNATSKLRSIEGLHALHTLGFRGQGLWAIAATARDGLSISSRPSALPVGAVLSYSTAGKPFAVSHAVAMAPGTVVRADGLACHEGVRAARVVREWLATAVLTRTETNFALIVDGCERWRSHMARTSADALASALRRPVADFRTGVAQVEGGLGDVRVTVGLPDMVAVRSARWLVVTVNGRAVRLPSVASAVRGALRLRTGMFPAALVECNLDAAYVDWNVSPMKNEVRVRDEKALLHVCESAIAALRDAMRWDPAGAGEDEGSSLVRLIARSGAEEEEFSTSDEEQVGWTSFKVVSQLLNTYILVESTTGITIVEQHVADERVLYEKYLASWQSGFKSLPASLSLPESMCDEQIFNLSSLGFDFEEAETCWRLKNAPLVLVSLAADVLVRTVLALSTDAHTMHSACAKLACDHAVRNGTVLSRARMRAIVGGLGKCKDARTCPHGRRTVVPLSAGALASLFGRRSGEAGMSSRMAFPFPLSGTLP